MGLVVRCACRRREHGEHEQQTPELVLKQKLEHTVTSFYSRRGHRPDQHRYTALLEASPCRACAPRGGLFTAGRLPHADGFGLLSERFPPKVDIARNEDCPSTLEP